MAAMGEPGHCRRWVEERRSGEGLVDYDLAFAPGFARHSGDARRCPDMDGAEGFTPTALDIEAEGVHDPVSAAKRRGKRGFVVHIGSDRLPTYPVWSHA